MRGAEPVSALGMMNSLRGLQHLPDSGELRAVLRNLSRLVQERSGGAEDPGLVTSSLYLLSKHHCTPASEALFTALTCLVARFPPSPCLSPRHIEMAVYGLHASRPDTIAARQLLLSLGPFVTRRPMPFGSVAATLHGLQDQSDSDGARAILYGVRCQLFQSGSTKGADGEALARALSGLRGQVRSPHVGGLLRLLLPVVQDESVKMGAREVSGALYSLSRLGDLHGARVDIVHALSKRVRGLPSDLAERLKMEHQGPVCATEAVVKLIVEDAGVKGLRFNVMHELGFEMDILTADGKLNIELGGTMFKYHSEGPQRIRARKLQDAGIEVVEIPVSGRRFCDVVGDIAQICLDRESNPDPLVALAWARACLAAKHEWRCIGAKGGGTRP
eukprot:Hpha_TRINITY_DN23249_c0_g1::TRINITY_DN23249_c0_g1_i1::g.30176::m.30176